MPTTNPVPSTDPSDLLFNAGKLDEVVNGTANSFTDRLGVSRRTVAGMNADFDAQLADAESDLNVYRADAAASAAEALGYLQTIRATSYGAYAEDPTTDPLGNPPTEGDEYWNTTAKLLKRWNGTTWQASDISTANLAASSGSSLVGYDGGTVQDVLDAVTGPNGAASVGFQPAGTGAIATTVEQVLLETVNVFRFMTAEQIAAVKAGTSIDDTDAIQKAIAHANSMIRPSYFSSIYNPGVTLKFQGKFNLASLSAPLQILCNIDASDAEFLIPAGYDKEVIQIGYTSGLRFLSGADISLPDIYKPLGSAIVPGSVGYRVYNVSASKIRAKKTWYFESGAWFGGAGAGCEHNEILLGQMFYCKRSLILEPGAGGWTNANTFVRGDIQQSPGYFGGSRLAGYRHIRLDGRAGTPVVGNVFIGTSIQGDASEYMIDCQQAYRNTFIAPYIETGFVSVAASVSGDTITSAGHQLVTGDIVAFQASSLPGGMISPAPYYVVAVSGDTFQVSLDRNGSVITFSSAGTGVTWVRSPRFLFAQTGNEACNDNSIENALYVPSTYLNIVETGQARNNGTADRHVEAHRVYEQESLPLWRGVNDYAGGSLPHPIFAAYAPGVKPYENPNLWTAALTSNGLAFASSGARTGEIYNSSGVLNYKRPSDSAAYEIASCRRSPGLLSVTSLSCAANSATSTDVTVTGASVNDHVLVTPVGLLTAGIIYSHAFVISANTVRVVFYNPTATPISLTTTLQAMVVRRFY